MMIGSWDQYSSLHTIQRDPNFKLCPISDRKCLNQLPEGVFLNSLRQPLYVWTVVEAHVQAIARVTAAERSTTPPSYSSFIPHAKRSLLF